MARGHIRKRSPGSWTIVVELEPDALTGKRRQKWSTVKGSRADADNKLAELLHKKATGDLPSDPAHWTLAQYLQHWLDTYVIELRPATKADYGSLVRTRILPYTKLANTRLAKVSATQIRSLYAELRTKGRPGGQPLSRSSVHKVHVLLKEALGHAVKWGILSRNVMGSVDGPPIEKVEQKVWTPEEARQFLTVALDDEMYRAPLLFALETGVRQSEVLGLRWVDLDLEAGHVQIRHTIQRVTGVGIVEGQPKTKHGWRLIVLTPRLVEMLRTHRARQAGIRLQLGSDWQDHGLVFPALFGKPMQPSVLYQAFVRLCAKAGVPRIKFHGLRHTNATLLLLEHVPTKVVSERLGHATTSITHDIYMHVLPGMQAEATEKLGELLQEKTK